MNIILKGGMIRMNGSCTSCYCFEDSDRSMRNFLTKEEKIELLREYKDKLDKESKGVSERITELEED